ncbi:Uncharacterized protein conserved in bacteria [Rodentibacter pneumotropicus]|uniref:Uncharacterized protein conserved in bacteria n=1 Tax=Rodentibacter pneumotropicus TaxID=758 RepID=A0A3S4UB18_9PAST|nr:Uncharacterized protein conserved in bacteria [Rodentibacter pneumotropicus]
MFLVNINIASFFSVFFVSSSGVSIEPEDLLLAEAPSRPCLSGSIKQKDLMLCVSKGYILAQKKLNSNYKISIQQNNQKIRDFLILSQRKWNSYKFKQCYIELENGREGEVNFIDCATKVIESRNELLESVFLCNFNKEACQFENDDIIELLGDK